MIRNKGRLSILVFYLKTLFQNAGYRAWLSLVLMVFSGLTQGVGLVMLIPFLGLIGLEGVDGPSGLAARVGRILNCFHLDLNLGTILCLYVGIVGVHAGMTRYQAVLNSRIVYGFTENLKNRLYQSLCRAEWLCLLRTKASDVTHAITQDTQRVGSATQQLLQLMGTAIIAGVHIAVSFLISVPMTLFALACGGCFLLLLRPLNRKAHGAGEDLRKSMTDMYSEINEHLGGLKVARSLGLDGSHQTNFRKTTRGITRQMVRFARVNATTRMGYEMGAAVALAGFFFVALEVRRIPAANLLIIVFLFARLLPRFSSTQQSVQRIFNALPSFEGVLEMEKRFMDKGEPPAESGVDQVKLKKEICLSHVSFRYDLTRDVWALRDVNLSIPARSMTAVLGPSGAGKSTLADLILGLLFPEQGMVTIDGQPLKNGLIHPWRHSVGYVPQDTFLFHDTIRANLRWALPHAEDDDLWSALEQAAAREFVSRLPDGLNTVAGDRGVRLSGGERQRIALARALLRRPSLLLLDEATSAVDNESELQIQRAVKRLHGELTVVVIAHRSSTILMADKIISLDKGIITDNSLSIGR